MTRSHTVTEHNSDNAFPCVLPENWHAVNYGLTKRELFTLHLAAAWVTALARRDGQPGYSDEHAAAEANYLAAAQAKTLLALLSDEERVNE